MNHVAMNYIENMFQPSDFQLTFRTSSLQMLRTADENLTRIILVRVSQP